MWTLVAPCLCALSSAPPQDKLQLALAVRGACMRAFGDRRPAPADMAEVACRAIASLRDQDARQMESLPPQGEYKFDDAIDFDQRYSIVSPRARQGDPLAAQTLGLLLFQGVGGADADAEASAEWPAAAGRACLSFVPGERGLGGFNFWHQPG